MAPLAWVKRLSNDLPELKKIPLFDWEAFSTSLASRFGVSKLQFRTRHHEMRQGAAIYKGIGTDFHTLQISLSNLGIAYWIMSKEDVAKLTTALMRPASKSRSSLSEILQEGFYRYLTLECLDTLENLGAFQSLTLRLTEEETVVDKALCIDVEIDLDQKGFWGRLVIPSELQQALETHFADRPDQYISTELAKNLELSIGVKTGSVTLSQEEWKKIKAGDFVLLDKESYDARKGSGMCLLMLEKTPLFNAKIKPHKIEITDYAFYHEESMSEETAALKELPIEVTVELARIKMTLDELMHLSPGKTLDLPIHPEQNVTLTVNGKKVGRAELLYLGHQLGIRILDI